MSGSQPGALLVRARTSTLVPLFSISTLGHASTSSIPRRLRGNQPLGSKSRAAGPSLRSSFLMHHTKNDGIRSLERAYSTQLSNYGPQELSPSQLQADKLEQEPSYTAHFMELLDAEMAEGVRTRRDRLSNWPLEQLVGQGYTLTNLHAYRRKEVSKEVQDHGSIVCFIGQPGAVFPSHLLHVGKPITIVPSNKTPLDSDNPVVASGTVIEATATRIDVKINTKGKEFKDTKKQWRLDLDVGKAGYIRTKQALQHTEEDPSNPRSMYVWPEILRRWKLGKGGSLDASSPSPAPAPIEDYKSVPGYFSSNPDIADWTERRLRNSPRKEGDPDLGLNETQLKAIALMLQEKISLIQGPPGTGKTRTIVEAVRLLKTHFKVRDRLLLCTYTNAAVDNLVQGLVAVGIKPLRIGAAGKVPKSLEQWTLEAQARKHPKMQELDQQKEELSKKEIKMARAKKSKKSPSKQDLTRLECDIKSLKLDIQKLGDEIHANVFEDADVICTTCLMAGSPLFKGPNFPVVFLDEASMCTEPASMIPIVYGCQHLSLIGDHQQLPPVIASRRAQESGLSKSLFERLIETNDIPRIMLNKQYRMHPSISEFSRNEFYAGALENGTVSLTGDVGPGFLPPQSRHLSACKSATGHLPSVLFVHHDSPEEFSGRSRINHGEMRIVAAIVEDLLLQNPNLKGEDIGIIAPYVAQINSLSMMLGSDPAWEASFADLLGKERAMQIKDIEVKTVDGFEGREKEVIIFSTVRNNYFGNIGFLADRRRMNVALTRARRGMFVLGSITTLSKKVDDNLPMSIEDAKEDVGRLMIHKGDEWKKYVDFVVARNMLFTGYHHPGDYRSQEEQQEFELMASLSA